MEISTHMYGSNSKFQRGTLVNMIFQCGMSEAGPLQNDDERDAAHRSMHRRSSAPALGSGTLEGMADKDLKYHLDSMIAKNWPPLLVLG